MSNAVTNNIRAAAIAAVFQDAVTQGLLEAGLEVVTEASVRAPKDTGELSRSGKAEMENPETVKISFGNDLPDIRAVAQEYGTIFQPAQPYLTPAIRDVDVAAIITRTIIKKIS